jgi:hypothetical protein
VPSCQSLEIYHRHRLAPAIRFTTREAAPFHSKVTIPEALESEAPTGGLEKLQCHGAINAKLWYFRPLLSEDISLLKTENRKNMKILIYLYLALVATLAMAVLLSLLSRLLPKQCPACQRLSLPLPMTVDGREALGLHLGRLALRSQPGGLGA